jgi:hypothetical protein
MTDRPGHGIRQREPSHPTITGRDVAGAGALMLSANLLCAGVGAGLGAVLGITVPLAVAGFLVGFFVGIYVVSKRFREI